VPALTRELVDIDGGALEIFRGGDGGRDGVAICTAHQYSVHTAEPGGWTRALLACGRVVAVNPPGAGASAARADPAALSTRADPAALSMRADPAALSMDQAVGDLEALRARLGEGRWIFAGASAGGMLGLLYALARPDALAGLIVCGSAPSWRYIFDDGSIFHPRHPAYAQLAAATAAAVAPHAPAEARRRWVDLTIEASLHKKELLPSLVGGARAATISGARLAAFLAQIHGPRKFDVSPRLGEIAVPTLVLCGRHDAQCPPGQSQLLASRIPGARLEIFDESGHYPYLEEPARFRAVIRAFIDDCTDACADARASAGAAPPQR
jgi:proline iminopeptidase